MIQTLYTIGKTLSKNEEYKAFFEPWGNPFTSEKIAEAAKVLVVEVQDGSIKDIQLENFSNRKLGKYLFRDIRGPNGTNLVPTFYFQLSRKADAEKWQKEQEDNIRKLHKRIKKSLENYKHDFLKDGEVEKLKMLLLNKARDLDKKASHIFTMRLDDKYFGDFEVYQKLFEAEAYSKYYDKSKAKNKTCSVTYQKKAEVWGKIDTMGFTTDKAAFVRNGFLEKDSYKMFPVSGDAVKLLEGSRKIADAKFSRSFYGLKYFVLPHFMNRDNEEAIEEILEAFIENCKSDTLQNTGASIIQNEHVLNAITKEEKLQNNVYYDILFFQQQQQQFLIKLHLNDIIPSRLKQVFNIKNQIEKRYDKITKTSYKDKQTKADVTRHFYINFGIIKDFFSNKVKTDYVFHPYFFKVLEAVFQGTKLDEQQILQAFLEKIKKDFKNQQELSEWEYQKQMKYSFALYQYFLQLGLFKNKTIMEGRPENAVQLTADSFIEQHPMFFDSEYKKGVFLLGYLSAYLMAKQYTKLKSKPFMKQLNSLNIDEKVVMQIFPKLINKMREYDTAVPDVEQNIAKYLVSKHELTKTDISYAFTLGIVMQKEFADAYFKAKAEEKAAAEA